VRVWRKIEEFHAARRSLDPPKFVAMPEDWKELPEDWIPFFCDFFVPVEEAQLH